MGSDATAADWRWTLRDEHRKGAQGGVQLDYQLNQQAFVLYEALCDLSLYGSYPRMDDTGNVPQIVALVTSIPA